MIVSVSEQDEVVVVLQSSDVDSEKAASRGNNKNDLKTLVGDVG